jgi:hypothetical protein
VAIGDDDYLLKTPDRSFDSGQGYKRAISKKNIFRISAQSLCPPKKY